MNACGDYEDDFNPHHHFQSVLQYGVNAVRAKIQSEISGEISCLDDWIMVIKFFEQRQQTNKQKTSTN